MTDSVNDLWHDRRWRRVAASLRAYEAVTIPIPGKSPRWMLSSTVFPGRMLGSVDQDEGGITTNLDQPAVQFSDSRCIPSRKADGDFGWRITER
jgi:hypothetical protein